MALWRSGTEAAHVPLTSPVTHVHNAAMASAGMACGCQRPGLSIGAKSTSVCPVLTIPVMPAVSAVMACAVIRPLVRRCLSSLGRRPRHA
jgi:hypothetical protein